MPILIKSKREGFRRCGVAHHKSPVVHPDGRFSDEELEILKKEPMLTVEEIADASADQSTDQSADQSTDQSADQSTDQAASGDVGAQRDAPAKVSRPKGKK